LTALVRTRPVVIQRFDPGAVRGASNAYRLGPFPGLKAFGRIEATRAIDGKTETDVRIFVLSRKLSPKALLETARDHWQIENALHWQHDVSFGEDAARNRKDNGPSNIAVIRRRALDVARLDQSKGSLTAKLKRAG
jgi:predicted transposase YbfD/YdcC